MIVRINPLDTFFFRDGKPFNMGDESWADGIFPPPPSVLYGALRSLWISQQAGQFSKENISQSENLTMKGVFLELNEKITFPIPNDIVTLKNYKDDKHWLRLTKNESLSSATSAYLLTPTTKQKVENFEDATQISMLNFKKYLKGHLQQGIIQKQNYLKNEPKIGIGRNNQSRTNEEGQLYRVAMSRFNIQKAPINLFVDCEGLTFGNTYLLKLGAEGKVASYQLNSESLEIDFPEQEIQEHGYFKVYLATPALFKDGYLPSWINENKYPEYEFLTASVSKSISIGGFDMDKKEPKFMLKAVPAGSVFFFKLKNEASIAGIKDRFHGKCISETLNMVDYGKQGFGLSYVAAVSPEQIKKQ